VGGILITGATGFIGKRLVKKLSLNKNYKIICFVRKNSKIKDLEKFKVNIIYGDMFDKNSILKALKNIDLIVHLATSHINGNEKLNLIGSKNIIESCIEKKVKRFVFISSMATKRKILDEYGKTKLDIEKILKSSSLDWTILRPSMIYSERNLFLLGKCISFPFIIPVIGNGKYKMDPVFIEDIIFSIEEVIRNKNSINKEYDLSGGERLSFNELINLCKKRFNIKKPAIHIPIFLCLAIFRFFPIISLESIRGINQDTNSDISNLVRDLKIKPRSFREGIKYVHI
jgi:nucleoside-diphosphate-sugar epimerase